MNLDDSISMLENAITYKPSINNSIDYDSTSFIPGIVDSDILDEFSLFNKKDNSFNSYDKQSSWFDKLFGRSKLVRNVVSKLKGHQVFVNAVNHTIEIRGINSDRLTAQLKELYENQSIYKIFNILYDPKDAQRIEDGDLKKTDAIKEGVFTYEFFALELIVLFEELYDKFKLPEYANIGKEIYEKTWVSKSDVVNPDTVDINQIADKFVYPPKDFQKEFILKYPKLKSRLNLNGYMLCFDQGLGKTYTSLALSACLKSDYVVIVVPVVALKDNWALEIKQHIKPYNTDDDVWKKAVYIQGETSKYEDQKYIITNMNAITKIDPIISSIHAKKGMLIVDETQNFRDISGKLFADLYNMKIKFKPTDVLMMSGTPFKASPSEICPALMMVDPTFTIEVAKVYSKCFSLDQILSTQIIQRRFNNVIYRKTKEEELPDLPPKNINDLKFKISNPSKYYLNEVTRATREEFKEIYNAEKPKYEAYEKEYTNLILRLVKGTTIEKTKEYLNLAISNTPSYLLSDDEVEFRKTFLDKYVYSHEISDADKTRLEFLLTNFVRRYQHCIGIALGRVLQPRREEMYIKLFNENMSRIIDMIRTSSKKTVIFTTYNKVANSIYKDLVSEGIGTVIVNGQTKDKTKELLSFKNDYEVSVLVATVKTLGAGFTLTEANQMFFFGLPWRGADFAQCTDRIHRIGQTSEVFIYKVSMDDENGNLSSRIDDIMEWSRKMTDNYLQTDNQESEFMKED